MWTRKMYNVGKPWGYYPTYPQDPYTSESQTHGLSFVVDWGVRALAGPTLELEIEPLSGFGMIGDLGFPG